jgi:hypothetical protein
MATASSLFRFILILAVVVVPTDAFVMYHRCSLNSNRAINRAVAMPRLPASPEKVVDVEIVSEEKNTMAEPAADATEEEKREYVASLAEDDEWRGLAMELSAVIVKAVDEDMKKLTRDFLQKDEYKVGDVSKEVDKRVKAEVARLRSKEEYELGDLSLVLDQVAKDMVCELTGKPAGEYQFGDLSLEIDKRVKDSVAKFCGQETYQVGDLSREIGKRAAKIAAEFAGKDEYSFGDVSKELNRRRAAWVQDYLGTSEYQFGDVTKKALTSFTGKDEYEFGDVTKKVLGGFQRFLNGNQPKGNNIK